MDTFGDDVGLVAIAMSVRHMALMGVRPEVLFRVALGRSDVVVAAIAMQATRLDREHRDIHIATMRRLEDTLDMAAVEAFRS